ncbi:hypothetical protein EVAR_67738_1 [Eumeta japonica]|uniref:Uncharacterized protein n=1 Tax=Eumeta variegata TaxID=151549 RepID=A0A4C1Z9U6_EUMVA|nr:hypothetical protein EVAR_67738_1 [Eumeta japonica]
MRKRITRSQHGQREANINGGVSAKSVSRSKVPFRRCPDGPSVDMDGRRGRGRKRIGRRTVAFGRGLAADSNMAGKKIELPVALCGALWCRMRPARDITCRVPAAEPLRPSRGPTSPRLLYQNSY